MATMSEMRKRIRTLWECAEEVGKAKSDDAVMARNDAALSVELAFSALHNENKRLKAKIAKIAKMDAPTTATLTRDAVRLVATIHQNLTTGMWFVRTSGNGDTHESLLDNPRYAERILSKMVEDGFEIEDPEHYCDLYGVLAGPVSQYEDSADAAEAPAVATVGSNGANERWLPADDEEQEPSEVEW